jgi:beta-phosphoglucomutase-like phosphatase (HAD superfamily)
VEKPDVIATLFDFDGVLVDSEPVHLAAFNEVLGEYGIRIDENEYKARYLSLDDASVFRGALSRAGRTVREEQVRSLVAAKNPRFMARFEDSFREFPGARELVARRATRGPVAIVSGALEREIVFALEKMGILSSVAFVVSAEHTPLSKPDPAPFLFAMDRLRRDGRTNRAVVVEDSTGGVTAAKRAGMRCVGVAHSYSRDELTKAGADATVDALAALTDELLEEGA